MNVDIERIEDKLSELRVYVTELAEDLPDEEDEYLEDKESLRKNFPACLRRYS